MTGDTVPAAVRVAESIVERLEAAGDELRVALTLVGEGEVRNRLDRVLAEIEDAVRSIELASVDRALFRSR